MRPEQGTLISRAQAMAALLELLTDQPLTLRNVPRLADVNLLLRILRNHGVDMTVDKPSLFIQAADDFFLAPDQRDLTDQYVTTLERHVVPNCGHWMQQERPAEVNALLIKWLTESAV